MFFEVLGQQVEVGCADAQLAQLVDTNFFAMRTPLRRTADLRFSIPAAFEPPAADEPGDHLFVLEKQLTVALQLRRADLLFLHAAALVRHGRVFLLVGDSGHGKSTTAWGLLHHGFEYLSDELAPIDLADLSVHAYPHALCLKQRPPAGYPLPRAGVLDLGDTLHVPVGLLPARCATSPAALAAVLFVHYSASRSTPTVRPIGRAEAAARLYTATLNALAHADCGLAAVLRVAQAVPCYALDAAELRATCERVCSLADGADYPKG